MCVHLVDHREFSNPLFFNSRRTSEIRLVQLTHVVNRDLEGGEDLRRPGDRVPSSSSMSNSMLGAIFDYNFDARCNLRL